MPMIMTFKMNSIKRIMFVICSKKFGGGYKNEPSIFDEIKKDDLIFAFFPCTRFEAKVPLLFRGQATQQKNWSTIKKMEYSMKLHSELHELYELISKLVVIVKRKGLRMIIENPYTQPHYLTTYWCIKPSLIDKNRRLNGDYYIKPTQYWFINCEVQNNLDFTPIELVEKMIIANPKKSEYSRQTQRSMIHPQYARRFIKQYVLKDDENERTKAIREANQN